MASNLVTIKYVGRHGVVEIDPDGLGEVSVVYGQTIGVARNKAGTLLAQPANWTLASSTKDKN